MIKANDIEMVKLGGMTPEERERYEKNKIEINKKVSSLIAEATKNAKLECCILCSKPCSSFCNSHSIPQFALKRIAEDGKVMLPLQDEILTIGKDTGVNKAGTFHIICRDCDSRTFQLYEDPNAYNSKPTDQMLAQIALKDVLLMISKRNQEREQYKLVGEQAEFLKDFADEKIYLGDFDLRDYGEDLEYARSSLDGRKSNRYYLCFYTVLDYVVPYVAQSSVTLISDFEDSIVNNIYSQEQKYRIKAIHVSVFPLKSTSAILLFIEDGVKRYRKFYRSLRKLPNDDQLAAINYLVFSYTENVFMNPTTHKELRKNDLFMDMCRKSTDFRSHTPFPLDDPLEAAVKEFSLSKRNPARAGALGLIFVMHGVVPFYTVRSQNSAPTYSQSASGFKSTCAPRCPAETPISSYKIAVSSINVGKCFFMPMGLHPPRI